MWNQAKTVLGYEPKVTLEDGIERSLRVSESGFFFVS